MLRAKPKLRIGDAKGKKYYKKEKYEESVKWYLKAAQAGCVDSQYILANCYLRGEGVPKNEQEAIDWYRKAAVNGNAFAQLSLAARGLTW